MGTLAIALLRLPNLDTQGRARVAKLDDAVLLDTNVDFASEPEEILAAVRVAAGNDAVDDHEDDRGIFVLPAVARPTTTKYDDVIAEVADLGMWIDQVALDEDDDEADDAFPVADALGADLDALVGQMMLAMGPDGIEDLQRAMTSGDPDAMEKMQAMVRAAMSQLTEPAKSLRQPSRDAPPKPPATKPKL
jgi:hypothetical protein